jgi:hypothetical protein
MRQLFIEAVKHLQDRHTGVELVDLEGLVVAGIRGIWLAPDL